MPHTNCESYAEAAGLEQHGRDHVAQRQERHRRRHDEESDLAQSAIQTLAEIGGDFGLRAKRAGHCGQFSRGYRHAEQADRQHVNGLRIE